MALGLLKWLQETSLYKRNILLKHEFYAKEKVILRRKKEFMNLG